LEPGQQFEQEHSGCVGDDLLDIFEGHSTESYSSQAWSVNCFGGVKVKVWTDTAESTNVMLALAGFTQCRDLIGKKMFVKYEAKVVSRLSNNNNNNNNN